MINIFELYRDVLRGELHYTWENEIIEFLLKKHELLQKTEDPITKEILIEEIQLAHEIWEAINRIIWGESYV